jgi:allantoinase
MFDTVVRSDKLDIGISAGRIAAVGPGIGSGKKEIDARGLTILPGLIDVHLHFNEPGRTEWEGAATGSRALAAGGGTLFFDMPLNSSPCTVGAREFDLKRAALEGSSITDFALWGGIIPGNVNRLEELADRGVIGYKAFMCDSGLPEFPRADDLTLFEGMKEAARLKLPVAVHAESQEITAGLSARMVKAGRSDIPAFLESRPVIAEVEAIQRAGLLAREAGCSLHIVHISSGKGVAAALEARASGTDVSIETCPHYLMFTAEDLERIGAIAKCAPPLRRATERDALWNRLLTGDVDIVASDHSPCPPNMKDRANFFEIWGGIAGVQSTRAVLADRGLPEGDIVRLTSSTPAKRFNIEHKGAIEIGFDADLALVDSDARETFSEETMLQRHRVNPYRGMTLRSMVRQTLRRGEVIYRDGAVTAAANGRFVRPKNKGY